MIQVSPKRPYICVVLLSKVEFNKNHNLHWGRLINPEDVKLEWHGGFVPDEKALYVLILYSPIGGGD